MKTNESIIEVNNLNKYFSNNNKQVHVLKDVSFTIQKGSTNSITGPSGSGKTTLLGLLAGMDNISSGSIKIANKKIELLNEEERSLLRLEQMGFVFQNFQLLANLTALENVLIPLELKRSKNAEQKAKDFLAEVGLAERYNHYPSQLSGGEQQRVAIARAFANYPNILLADEPTGNLDEETSVQIEELLFKLNKDNGTTLIIVTHDLNLAAKTDNILTFKSGSLV